MRKNSRLAAFLLITAMTAAELGQTWVMAGETEGNFVELVSEEAETGVYREDVTGDRAADKENAAYALYYEAADPDKDVLTADEAVPVQTAEGVTEEMCEAGYWSDKTTGSGIASDMQLMTKEEIINLNRKMLDEKDACMYDLENMELNYNADKLRDSLTAGTTTAKKEIYADGVSVDPTAYYKEVADAIAATGYEGASRANEYAIAVKRTTINNIPVNAYIGYNANDSDDEKVNAALLVGEHFVIRQKATVFGDDFYWGYSDNCTGWVAAGDLAVCRDKDEWLDAWKIDPMGDDFIVVTQNQITLEPSVSRPELSSVKLTFSTILKSVPTEEIPESIAERGPWNNYVVYLPGRDEEGKYIKRIALISQHYEVSRGFLEMTQEEIMRVAFNNLGDRYGWGGMLDSMDCSMYTRNIYRCFGLMIPRNTTWQQAIPGRKIDLSGMSDEEKLKAMSRMSAGTLFFLPGHTMVYTGTVRRDGQDMAYVISDAGSLSDSAGETKVRSMYSVILNPLSVRRRNGTTWVGNITAAVLPVSDGCFGLIKKNIESAGQEEVSMNRVPAAEGQDYASTGDTLPLETFLGNTQNIFISFDKVKGSGVPELTASVVKGSKITSKVAVSAVRCDRSVASYSINKRTSLASVTLKKSGLVSFDMADGNSYDVYFTVDTPKAATAAVNKKLKEAKEAGTDKVVLTVTDLFASGIDGGSLKIEKQKGTASVFDNRLVLDPNEKNTVRVSYVYLNKKYSMTLSVK